MISREKIIKLCIRLQRYSVYSLVFFIPIYFAWFQENYSVFDLNKSVVLHFILSIISVAWLLEITLTRKISWGGNKKIGLTAIALAIVFLISTIFSLHPNISLFGSYERHQGLYNLLSYLEVWFFILITIRSKEHLRQLIISLLIGSAFVCVYGLIQAFGLDPLSWGEDLGGRIFSSLGQPNFLGHYLIVVLPFTLYAIFYWSKNIYIRSLCILLFAVEGSCLIFTWSRGAWIAALGCLFLLFLWMLVRKNKKIYALIILFFAISLLIVTSFTTVRQSLISFGNNNNFKTVNRLISVLDFESGSTKIRQYYWSAAIQAITKSSLSRKLFGFGPDVIPDIYVKAYEPQWAYYERINAFPDRAHNFILDILLQFGFVGLLVYGFFSSYIIVKLGKHTWKQESPENYWLGICFLFAMVAYGINNFFSFSLVSMNVVFYGLLAGGWLIINQFKQKEVRITFFQPFSLLIITLFFSIFLLVLFYFYNLKFLVADYYYFEVKKGEARGDCRRVLDNMEKVLDWYQTNHYYNRAYLSHGTNCFIAITDKESQKQLADNLLHQADLISQSDWQFLTILDLAHMYSMLGYYIDKKYYDQADIMYTKLMAIGPMITSVYQDYGRMKLNQEKYSDAISLFTKGIKVARLDESMPATGHVASIYRQVAYFNNLLGSSFLKEKKYNEAQDYFKRAINLNPTEGSYYKDMADYYYQRGDISSAIDYNNLGYSKSPESHPWFYLLALLYNDNGDRIKALEYAQKASLVNPDDSRIKDLIKKIEMKK